MAKEGILFLEISETVTIAVTTHPFKVYLHHSSCLTDIQEVILQATSCVM